MSPQEYKEKKSIFIKHCNIDFARLAEYDPSGDDRLSAYIREVRDNPDAHNLYEILAVIKFLRLLDKYTFVKEKVCDFISLYERLKFDGANGRQSYKLTPIQVFQFSSILGFYKEEENNEGEKELRRLVRSAILFVPRKFSKTTSVASLAINELFFGDSNAQAFCAANSFSQAQIAYKAIRKALEAMSGADELFKFTRDTIRWRPNKYGQESYVQCLSGNGRTKDGLNASLVIYDEYAAARYVKDHSDGAELLNVLNSSMGARKEPLTVIITTASRVMNGPFQEDLDKAKAVLRGEIEMDSQFASIFEPDEWEKDEKHIGNPDVWKKVQPHLGVTVQKGFYAQEYEKAMVSRENMIEFKTKLLNIFQSDSTQNWIEPREIHKLQTDFDIMQPHKTMKCVLGLDFSVCDDLSICVYGCYDNAERMFFFDLRAYIPEKLLHSHVNARLYQRWVEDGWLQVCPGEVIDEHMITADIDKASDHTLIIKIAYDSYKSRVAINDISEMIFRKGGRADNILLPFSQTFASFNSPVETFTYALKQTNPRIRFSNNPIWGWAFGNAYIAEDMMGNKKPVKRNVNEKIDPVIGVVECIGVWQSIKL